MDIHHKNGVDYFTASDVQEIIDLAIQQFLQNDTFIALQNKVDGIKSELDNNTMLIIESGEGD